MLKTEIRGKYAIDTVWLTADEAAGYVRIKTRTLLLRVRQGEIKGYPLSGNKRRVWRFLKSDLDAMLLARGGGVLCSASPSVLTIKEDRDEKSTA
jgi:excisionase family DNA binding protein